AGAAGRRRSAARGGYVDPVSGRDDDRAAARGAGGRGDRRRGGLLLLRHERPHPDHVRHLPRRRRVVPADLHPGRGTGRGSVPGARPRGRRAADRPRHGGGARGAPAAQGGSVRRARRRPPLHRLLPRAGARLRVLLAVPGAGRPPGRGARGAGGRSGSRSRRKGGDGGAATAQAPGGRAGLAPRRGADVSCSMERTKRSTKYPNARVASPVWPLARVVFGFRTRAARAPRGDAARPAGRPIAFPSPLRLRIAAPHPLPLTRVLGGALAAVLAACTAGGGTNRPAGEAAAPASTRELVLLGTTDVHGRLYAHDYYTGGATDH